MVKDNERESIIRIILLIIGIYIIIKLFMPIIKPVSEATDKSNMRNNFYQVVIGKTLPSFQIVMDELEDEEKQDLFPLVFKYLTNIDISNPKSYIASQIPVLNLIDISSIMTTEEGPIIINVKDNDIVKENTQIVDNKKENEKEVTKITENKSVNTNANVKPKAVDSSKPLVFIFHTHTTEAYNPDNIVGNRYSEDINKNVCLVGEKLKQELENKYGISCIHDMTIHDLPKREGGYAKARPTIEKYLKKYPSVKLVIDLHRDGGVPKNRATAIINNEGYARVLFVVGAKNPNYKKNAELAQKYQASFENTYHGFCRGISYQPYGYNQGLSSKMLLLEVGCELNTMNEALNSSKIIAKIISTNIK